MFEQHFNPKSTCYNVVGRDAVKFTKIHLCVHLVAIQAVNVLMDLFSE